MSNSTLMYYDCPICAPRRFFATKLGLHSHVEERHPWRLQVPIAPSHLSPLKFATRHTSDQSLSGGSDEVFLPNSRSTHTLSHGSRQVSPISVALSQHSDSPYSRQRHEMLRRQHHLTASVPNLHENRKEILQSRSKLREQAILRRPWYTNEAYKGPKTLLESEDYRFDSDDDWNKIEERSTRDVTKTIRDDEIDYSSHEIQIFCDHLDQKIEHPTDQIQRLHNHLDKLVVKKQRQNLLQAKEEQENYLKFSNIFFPPHYEIRSDFIESNIQLNRPVANTYDTNSIPYRDSISEGEDFMDALPPVLRNQIVRNRRNDFLPLSDEVISSVPHSTENRHFSSKATSFSRLSSALFLVFKFLNCRTLARCAFVSREWLRISREPALWRHLRLHNLSLDATQLANMALWCCEVCEISFQSIQMPSSSSPIPTGALEDSFEKLLLRNAASLRKLRILDCGQLLTSRAVWLASCLTRKLEHLVYLSEFDPVGAELLWALGQGCPQIHTLIVPPVQPNEQPKRFDDRCCRMIGRCWRHLQES